jgi:putative effector of murein hydrolase LrgA (UPF0299 family)
VGEWVPVPLASRQRSGLLQGLLGLVIMPVVIAVVVVMPVMAAVVMMVTVVAAIVMMAVAVMVAIAVSLGQRWQQQQRERHDGGEGLHRLRSPFAELRDHHQTRLRMNPT